jgi:hypothetical protein
VSRLHFDRLLYAEDAVNSNHAFHDLREKGEIPAHRRFQVCLPATASATLISFPDGDDRRLVDAADEDAFEHELVEILDHIPADDLPIQIDACPEVIDLEAPLSLSTLEIDPAETRVYMGIIHPDDEEDGVRKRAAYVCGFGRLSASSLPELIESHAAAAQAPVDARGG